MFDVDGVVVVRSRRYGTQHRSFYCRCLTSLRFWPVLAGFGTMICTVKAKIVRNNLVAFCRIFTCIRPKYPRASRGRKGSNRHCQIFSSRQEEAREQAQASSKSQAGVKRRRNDGGPKATLLMQIWLIIVSKRRVARIQIIMVLAEERVISWSS